MKMKEQAQTFASHFTDKISDSIKLFVRDDVLFHSRYLFVRRVGPFQYGRCTHCKSDHIIESSNFLKHNTSWECKRCKSLVWVKQAGRGRGRMFDTAYAIWYEKSKTNPLAITATGYKVTRDYREDMEGVTSYLPVARYVFEPGNVMMMQRNHYTTGIFGNTVIHYEDGWKTTVKPHSIIGKHYFTRYSSQSIRSIVESIQDTSFKYSTWEKYAETNEDLIYFFAAYAKYPFIEYLTKMGMQKIVIDMINRNDLHRSINYKGKTMEKILGLTKHEIKAWKASNVIMKPIVLRTYKWFRDQHVPITWEKTVACESLITSDYYFKMLKNIMEYASLDRIMKYVSNQIAKDSKHNTSTTSTISTWADYIKECIELGMDLNKEHFLFPNNLYKEHQKNIRKMKVKKDEAINAKIMERVQSLLKYSFSSNGLLVRPAASSIELFDEGKALNHCVGSYADRYAGGSITLFLIRRETEPTKPFYTLEIIGLNNSIPSLSQCRGKGNCNMTDEIKTFVDLFIAKKLLSKKRARIDVTNMNRDTRREAVV